MLLYVNGTEYDVTDFQNYEEVFTKYSYMEYHKFALSYLMDALTDQKPLPGEELQISLSAEMAVTEMGKPCSGYKIHFLVNLVKEPEEGPLLVSYYYMDFIDQVRETEKENTKKRGYENGRNKKRSSR